MKIWNICVLLSHLSIGIISAFLGLNFLFLSFENGWYIIGSLISLVVLLLSIYHGVKRATE